MSFAKTEKGKEIVGHITLKNVKSNFGHDLAGMYAHFFLDGKKMGFYNDDGHGGEAEIRYISPTHQTQFENFMKSNGLAELMFENGWDFMESAEKIDLNSQTEELVNAAFNLRELKKVEAKVKKDCLKAICFGKGIEEYRMLKFQLSFKDIVEKFPNGLEYLQAQYERVKSEMKEGDKLLNTNLEKLGIKL